VITGWGAASFAGDHAGVWPTAVQDRTLGSFRARQTSVDPG
jgi:hypothetical protein